MKSHDLPQSHLIRRITLVGLSQRRKRLIFCGQSFSVAVTFNTQRLASGGLFQVGLTLDHGCGTALKRMLRFASTVCVTVLTSMFQERQLNLCSLVQGSETGKRHSERMGNLTNIKGVSFTDLQRKKLHGSCKRSRNLMLGLMLS